MHVNHAAMRYSLSNPIAYYILTNTVQLKDEPTMTYSRLWAHDGNNSLKRVLPFGNRIAGDVRTLEDDDIFLPRSFVDRFAREVKPTPAKPTPDKPAPTKQRRESAEGDSTSDESGSDTEEEGDPTDGAQSAENEIDDCVKNWKAAASDDKKRSWAIYDETGLYASACRHGLILWICDMVRSGEL